MDPGAVPESPRPKMRLQRLSAELQRDWGVTIRIFDDYRELPPHKRYRALGMLFERLCPWIERGIQSAVLNHFVLVPTEQALSRAFACTTQKEALPRSYVLYLHWVESIVMRGLVKQGERFTDENHTPGDPSAALCARFNAAPYHDRAPLFLFLVEGCSPTEVSDNTGIPYPRLLEELPKWWDKVRADEPKARIPTGWQIPQLDQEGKLLVQRRESQ